MHEMTQDRTQIKTIIDKLAEELLRLINSSPVLVRWATEELAVCYSTHVSSMTSEEELDLYMERLDTLFYNYKQDSATAGFVQLDHSALTSITAKAIVSSGVTQTDLHRVIDYLVSIYAILYELSLRQSEEMKTVMIRRPEAVMVLILESKLT